MLRKFHLDIEPEVLDDLQEAVNYYNRKKDGLGKEFYNTVDRHFEYLKKNYTLFGERYDDIRCMPVEKFPYLIHYRILKSQKTVSVKAVFCSYNNPEKWHQRTK